LREVRGVLASSQLRDVRGAATDGDLPHDPAERRGLAADSTRLERCK
jgi:hypothetical protein